MGNPLLGHRIVTSKETQDRSDAVPPVAEEYAGDNNPYRGIESHGVAPTVHPDPVPGIDGTHLAKYVPKEPQQAPIPVIIVTEGGRELKTWQTRREYATGQANRIVAQNEHRTACKVRNIGTIVVWVHPDPSVSTWIGYPLAPNTELDFPGETDVWTVSDDNSQVPLAILEQITVKQT